MSALFVAATGTDIGKTFVAAAMLRYLRGEGIAARGLKPVVSGYDPQRPAESDPGVLLTAMGLDVSDEAIDAIAPFRYAAPLAPTLAARREGRRLPFEDVVSFCRAQIAAARSPLLIEGVGGVMSPIAEDATGLDLVEALKLGVLLVAGSHLGAISHTLTAIAAIRERRLEIAGIALNQSAEGDVGVAETREQVAHFVRDVPVFVVRRDNARDDVWRAIARATRLMP